MKRLIEWITKLFECKHWFVHKHRRNNWLNSNIENVGCVEFTWCRTCMKTVKREVVGAPTDPTIGIPGGYLAWKEQMIREGRWA